MSAGIRVVRSGYWKQGQLDGGEGHMGTIFKPEDKSTSSDKCYVVWDNGNTTVCGIGMNGELLIYDNAPTGANHPGVRCDSCDKSDFLGVRWKCSICSDYDLCNPCYMMQKHSMDHQFLRITTNGGERVLVGKRHGSVQLQAWGICKDAEVTRGVHWKWGDQDGGGTGTVQLIANWSKTSWRSGARVKWKNGSVKGYRVGFDGAVDLKYLKEHKSELYYRDHLAYVGQIVTTPKAAANDSDEFQVGNQVTVREVSIDLFRRMQADYGGFSDDLSKIVGKTGTVKEVLKYKDMVYPRIKFDDNVYTINPQLLDKVTPKGATDDFLQKISNLKEGPSRTTTNEIPSVTIPNANKASNDDDDFVQTITQRTSHAEKKTPQKRPDSPIIKTDKFASGDKVRVKNIVEYQMKEMQELEGCSKFNSDMKAVCGKTGTVIGVDETKAVTVSLGGRSWKFNPKCIGLIEQGPKSKRIHGTISAASPQGERKPTDDGPIRAGDIVKVKDMGMDTLMSLQNGHGGFTLDMTQAIGKTGKAVKVNIRGDVQVAISNIPGYYYNPACLELQSRGDGTATSGMGSSLEEDLLRLLIGQQSGISLVAAAANGDMSMVDQCIRRNPSSVDMIVKDVTALMAACAKGHKAIVERLLQAGAGIEKKDKDGWTAIFFAVHENHHSIVELLLVKRCNVNVQDNDMRTCLHLAAGRGYEKCVAVLLMTRFNCDRNIKERRGATALHLAVGKGHNTVIELLVKGGANLNIQDNDGDTCAHVALMTSALSNMLPPELLLFGMLAGAGLRGGGGNTSKGVAIAVFLVVNGANLTIQNKQRKTPLDYAGNLQVRNKLVQAQLHRAQRLGGGAR